MFNDHFMKILVTFVSIIFFGIIALFVISNLDKTHTDKSNIPVGNFGSQNRK